ncbi:hypothetical protein M409DRAFT_30437 [Zasmidium cellare ATCC 36951]|uniref:Uncharacterized protein n=1 Tax=Zasmidium cellare ATCC 36951 TaxID=1080233 RepID=A0A6A6BX44_ZASCE|nr:uncharacterized protein M409DRAFT_30437 [Zasmidium cellare ATCC 36951]KAF2159153.1 hypothetical protein M409DRAFT_30437 [Zasmidium cellare ATCC 36951]
MDHPAEYVAAELAANEANENVAPKAASTSTEASYTTATSTEASYATAQEEQPEERDAFGIDSHLRHMEVSVAPEERAPEGRPSEAGSSVPRETQMLPITRRQRLVQSDYKVFRALDVRGSKNCSEHCPLRGTLNFCRCPGARPSWVGTGHTTTFSATSPVGQEPNKANISYNDGLAKKFAREFIETSKAMMCLKPVKSKTGLALKLVDFAMDRFKEGILGPHPLHQAGSQSPDEELVCHMVVGPPENLKEVLVMPHWVVKKDQSIHYTVLASKPDAIGLDRIAELRRTTGDADKDFRLLTGRERNDSKVQDSEASVSSEAT